MTQAVSPVPLHALIVLGARLNPRGEPGRVAKLRLRHALQIWREYHEGCPILLTGGQVPGTTVSEARAMADWSQFWVEENWGPQVRKRFEACLLLDEASLNTLASARHTLILLKGLGAKEVGLVTDAVHIHRARFIFRQHFQGQGIAVHPLPARGLVRHYWRHRRYLWLTKMALREGGAWVKVFVRQALRFLKP